MIESPRYPPHLRRILSTFLASYQDEDFEAVPENQDFTLTLEKPTKFGYSPGFKTITGGPALPSPGSRRAVALHADSNKGATLRTNGTDYLPPSGPGLFRNRTAPLAAGSLDGDSGVGAGSGAFVQWSSRGGSEGGGGKALRHQRNETLTDYRFESIGSTADWSQTFEGEIIGFAVEKFFVCVRVCEYVCWCVCLCVFPCVVSWLRCVY